MAVSRPVQDYPAEDFRHVVDICLTGTFLCIKHQARQFIAAGTGGSIVNIASLNATQAAEGFAAYCSAKAGVVMLTQVAALELGRHNIRVNAIGPGLIRTPATEGLRSVPGLEDAFIAEAPLGRAGEPEDVASVATFLASDASALMSGQALYLDGGASLNKYPPLFDFLRPARAPRRTPAAASTSRSAGRRGWSPSAFPAGRPWMGPSP